MNFKIIVFLLLIAGNQIFAQQNTVLDAAKKEMQRQYKELSKQDTPPYFLAYNIIETKRDYISASFGNISNDSRQHRRVLDIDLRVGDYKFDNTHIIRGNPFNFMSGAGAISLPLENDEEAIRKVIWFATDRNYKDAIERYEKALTNEAVKVAMEDTSADFSREQPSKYVGKITDVIYDKEYWSQKLRDISSLFSGYPWIYQGDAFLNIEHNIKTIVTTEGTELHFDEHYIRMSIRAKTKADDGTSLPIYKNYFAFTIDQLPSQDIIEADVAKMINELRQLKDSEILATYSGPALLSGEASGVFFHEIFGHRVEGHREKDPNSSQMFKKAIDEKILPEYMNVIFDPGKKELAGKPLSGYFKYDDEGVKAEKVVTVENGIFQNFLMSRVPIEGFPNSNGHGRKQPGYKPVTRQSNLIVTADKTHSQEELRQQLIEMCKEENREFGLFIDLVQEGFTLTGRQLPNSFNVHPVLIYKVYVDGRPDEMVRGLNMIGTPMTTFANIVAAGDDMGVFNGICGAESGGIPVSACSPSLLLSKIETQNKPKSQAKPPLLPSPVVKSEPVN